MNCNEARRRISESLDEKRADASLSVHVAGCPACARALSRGRALGAALAALPERRPSAGFSAAVLSALRPAPKRAPAYAGLKLAALAGAAAESVGLVWAASHLPGLAALASFAARLDAQIHVASRLFLLFLPAPRAGAEFSVASLLAAAAFAAISTSFTPHSRTLGAKS